MLNDRFKRSLHDHREATKVNSVASGIIELRGERKVLLDGIVQVIDEVEEGWRAERNEQTQLNKRLKEAGENMRNLAVQREGRRHHILKTNDNSGERGVPDVDEQSSSAYRAKKRRIIIQGAVELHEEGGRE